MTREIILESVWQILSFYLPLDQSKVHMFYYEFLEGKKATSIFRYDGVHIGEIEESLLSFICALTHPEYQPYEKEIQKKLDNIAVMGQELIDRDNKQGKFREIKFNGESLSYGLQDGDIIEGFGFISPL